MERTRRSHTDGTEDLPAVTQVVASIIKVPPLPTITTEGVDLAGKEILVAQSQPQRTNSQPRGLNLKGQFPQYR